MAFGCLAPEWCGKKDQSPFGPGVHCCSDNCHRQDSCTVYPPTCTVQQPIGWSDCSRELHHTGPCNPEPEAEHFERFHEEKFIERWAKIEDEVGTMPSIGGHQKKLDLGQIIHRHAAGELTAEQASDLTMELLGPKIRRQVTVSVIHCFMAVALGIFIGEVSYVFFLKDHWTSWINWLM